MRRLRIYIYALLCPWKYMGEFTWSDGLSSAGTLATPSLEQFETRHPTSTIRAIPIHNPRSLRESVHRQLYNPKSVENRRAPRVFSIGAIVPLHFRIAASRECPDPRCRCEGTWCEQSCQQGRVPLAKVQTAEVQCFYVVTFWLLPSLGHCSPDPVG